MDTDDKIFALVAQAEDIQEHAIDIQETATKTLKAIPEVARAAVLEATKELIAEGAEQASKKLLTASKTAERASAALRRTGIMQGFFLVAVIVVMGAIGWAGVGYLVKSRVSELAGLNAAIARERGTLADLKSQTWGLELIDADEQRAIILPRGVKFNHAGPLQDGSGRVGLVINP